MEELEIDKALRGCYYNGIMKVILYFPLSERLESFSKKDFATFVHEYVHFLQNLTTPWGLYCSMNRYRLMGDIISKAQAVNDIEINLPIIPDYYADSNRIIALGDGKKITEDEVCIDGLKIDVSKDIHIHRKICAIGKQDYDYIILDIPFKGIGYKQVRFGAWTIKESMAAIIQEMIAPDCAVNHSDIPYNIVKIYCNKQYPQLNGTPKKILAALYVSLFSLRPGVEFFNIIDSIAEIPDEEYVDSIKKYLSGLNIKIDGKDEMPIADFYKDISSRFLFMLQKFIKTPPNYIGSIMQATQIEHGRYPLLELIESEITPNSLEEFIKITGAPLFLGSEDTCKNPAINSSELPMLYALEMISTYLSNPFSGCPNKSVCINDGRFDTSLCFDEPWKHNKDCPMYSIAQLLGVVEKNTKITYGDETV